MKILISILILLPFVVIAKEQAKQDTISKATINICSEDKQCKEKVESLLGAVYLAGYIDSSCDILKQEELCVGYEDSDRKTARGYSK